jgi:mycothiol synthase
MTTPRVLRAPDRDAVAALRGIDDAVRVATGHEAVPEAVWRAVVDTPDACLLALAADGAVGAVTMPSDSFTPAHRQLAVAATPDLGPHPVATVVDAVLGADAAASLTAWLPGSVAAIATALEDRGFRVDRRQHQMRVPLPRPDVIRVPDGVALRAFRPGTDDAAWLTVNNRAFANHPDQGGWIEEILVRRMAEPWFDAAGFLLAWRHDDLAGFCWTKVHTEPEHLGEIFVIGVDPGAQGLGLGRALVLAGLDHLAQVRGCPNGVLYVAAANTPAVSLYESLGFGIHRTDTALVLDRS